MSNESLLLVITDKCVLGCIPRLLLSFHTVKNTFKVNLDEII